MRVHGLPASTAELTFNPSPSGKGSVAPMLGRTGVRAFSSPRCRVEIRNPALYLNGDLMYSVKSEISQEGEGESAPGLWSESSDVERIPSPICSQRSDGIWSVEARIHKVDPNIAPD